jgi:D-3-phosphoglycerate dehydrogenase
MLLGGVVNAGAAKIVEVKGMALEADFHPVMLFVNNSDKTGFIGALGMMLAEANINIATFNLGRQAAGQDAIAIVGVDQVVPEAIQHKLRASPQVRYVKELKF